MILRTRNRDDRTPPPKKKHYYYNNDSHLYPGSVNQLIESQLFDMLSLRVVTAWLIPRKQPSPFFTSRLWGLDSGR